VAVWCAFGVASLAGPWVWRVPLQSWMPGRMLAAAMGVLVLGETLSGMQLLAFGLCLAGVVLATFPSRRS